MGQLTMIPICGSSQIEQLRGLGWGNKKSFLRISSFVQKWWVDENDRLKIVQCEPVSPCFAMAEGALTMAQMARKQASNTDI